MPALADSAFHLGGGGGGGGFVSPMEGLLIVTLLSS
jgi:hypothetical protein